MLVRQHEFITPNNKTVNQKKQYKLQQIMDNNVFCLKSKYNVVKQYSAVDVYKRQLTYTNTFTQIYKCFVMFDISIVFHTQVLKMKINIVETSTQNS